MKEYNESTIEREKGYYFKYLEDIKKTYQTSKDWNKTLSETVYNDIDQSQEAFIDYVEEVYKTKIKDVKHLKELTGCNEFTDNELKDIITSARYSKYFTTLETALQEGANYKGLLKINPKEYGLPKTWNGTLSSDQYSSIIWAIAIEYGMAEAGGLMLYPSIREVAKKIDAPYSVVMDAYKIINK